MELRIHGVGGSTPERLLGELHAEDVVETDHGYRTGVWARRRDPSIRGYVWGGLTSGAKLQPLWVLLLPFTVLNVAGWMHPPVTASRGRRRQVRDIRRLVTLLGFTLTATWAVWLAIIVADLGVYQWGATRSALAATPFLWAVGAGAVLLVAGFLWHRWGPLMAAGALVMLGAAAARNLANARVRAVMGVVLAELLLAAVAYISGISRRHYETHLAGDVKPVAPRTAESNEDLRSSGFFAHPEEGKRLLVAHAVLVAGVTVLLCLRAWGRAQDGKDSLDFGSTVVALGAVQFALLAVLAVRSLGEWEQYNWRWRFAGPAVAAGLGFIFATAVFTGVAIWISDRLADPRSGAELALADVFVEDAVVVAVVLLLAFLPYFLSGGPAPAPPGTSREEKRWRKPRYARQRLARAVRHGDLLATAAVGFLVVAGLTATVLRVDLSGSALPWHWSIDPDGGLGITRRAAGWLLPFLVPLVGAIVRLGARSAGARRNIGNLWDVLGLWPRRFHPFAVRPYAERAVPELQDLVRSILAEGKPLVVSAHSQGAVLAFVALIGIAPEENLTPVALVMYGSPLGRLHARFFPAYFGPSDRLWLLRQLHSWRSFFRRTDHIGHAVFDDPEVRRNPAVQDVDVELPDPAETPPGASRVPPPDPGLHLECDRTPWFDLAGHNDYPREPRLKAWVAEVKEDLGVPAPR